jgi:hypothetical protein
MRRDHISATVSSGRVGCDREFYPYGGAVGATVPSVPLSQSSSCSVVAPSDAFSSGHELAHKQQRDLGENRVA